MGEEEQARKDLHMLEKEHHSIEEQITRLIQESVFDQLSVQRLKRKKLALKDRIAYLRSFIYDDIIA